MSSTSQAQVVTCPPFANIAEAAYVRIIRFCARLHAPVRPVCEWLYGSGLRLLEKFAVRRPRTFGVSTRRCVLPRSNAVRSDSTGRYTNS